MPPGKKTRRGSGGNDAALTSAPLGERERLIEVIAHATVSCAADAPALVDKLVMSVQFDEEMKVTVPFAQLERDAMDDAARHVQTTLLAKRVTLSPAVVGRLCGDEADHRVALHLPAAVVVDGTVVVGRGSRPSPAPSKSSGPTPDVSRGRQERIRSARGTRRELGPSCGECVAQVALSVLDVLVRQRTCCYDVFLSSPIAGLERCWVELRCSDVPLLQPQHVLEEYRPVCVTLTAMDPPPAPQSRQRPEDAAEELELEVGLLGCVRRTRLRSCDAPTRRPWRTLFLLRDASPLTVYQQLLLEPVTLTLHSVGTERVLLGTGSFSLRPYLDYAQTSVHELVQLLPRRASVTSTESCLTTACTASVEVDLFVPFPRLRHVAEDGSPAPRRFLARAVLMLPYDTTATAPWVGRALECLLTELRRLPPAVGEGSEVHLYHEPDPVPDVHGDDAAKVVGSDVEDSSSEDDVDAAGDRARRVAEPAATPELLCDPPAPFARPFCVVSPDGVSGFEVMDATQRVICLEGPVEALHRVLRAVAHAADHADALRLLFNAELFAPRRAYGAFPPLITPPPRVTAESRSTDRTPPRTRRRSRSRPPSAPPEAHDDVDDVDDEDVGKGDAEASGTGGRLHRVRLRETLTSIALQPRYLLRRALSEACLRCVRQLYALQQCTTMREAVDRDCFPTAADLVALERSFGQTLELADLGTATRDAFDDNVAARPTTPQGMTRETPCTPPRRAALLTEDSVGSLVHLVGSLYTGNPRRVPHRVRELYPTAAWMRSAEGELVLCAFAAATPGRTIRYHIEGQVTRCDGTLLLYVLTVRALAVSQTVCSNAAFEARLRHRARAVREHATRRAKPDTTVVVTDNVGGDASRSPSVSESGDDNAPASWPRAPVCGDGDASWTGHRAPLPDSAAAADSATVRATKSSRLLAGLHKPRRPMTEEYALWWELYNQRAPKNVDEAHTTALRRMHF